MIAAERDSPRVHTLVGGPDGLTLAGSLDVAGEVTSLRFVAGAWEVAAAMPGFSTPPDHPLVRAATGAIPWETR